MPQVLMELMQHESINTTLKYCVGKNAQRTSKVAREAYEKSRKDSETKETDSPENGERDTNPFGHEKSPKPKSSKANDVQSTPGRIRTCNQRIRNPLLYPLSYGRQYSTSTHKPFWYNCLRQLTMGRHVVC